jgi:hypothetical protein
MLGAAAGAALAKVMPAAPAPAFETVKASVYVPSVYGATPSGLPYYVVMSPGQLRAYERLGYASNTLTPEIIDRVSKNLLQRVSRSPIDRQTKFPV